MEMNELTELGLTKAQAQVYLTLIENAEQTGGEIAKKLNIDRSFTYNVLKSLARKGFVSYVVKHKKQFYCASDPENFVKEIEEKKEKALSLVSKLKALKKRSAEPKTRIYQGKQGLKTYLREIFNTKEIHILDGGKYPKILDVLKFDYPHYIKEIVSKKIKVKIITSQGNTPILKEIFGNSAEIKIFEDLEYNAGIIMINNKISFHSGKENPNLTVIEDDNIVKMMNTYFNHLWNISKK